MHPFWLIYFLSNRTSFLVSLFFLIYIVILIINNLRNNFIKIEHSSKYDLKDLTLIIPVRNEKKENLERIKKTYNNKIKFYFVGDARVKPYIYNIGSKKENLKKGLELVDTELVGFLDSDSIVSIEDIKKAISYFSEKVGGVSGRIFPIKSKKPSYFYSNFYYRLSDFINYGSSLLNKSQILNGNFAIYRTDIVKKAFDEISSRNIGDDKELPNYLISSGYDAVLAKDVKIYTDIPTNWKKFLKQVVRWNKSYILNNFSLISSGKDRERGILFSLVIGISLTLLFLTPFSIFLSLVKFSLIFSHLILSHGLDGKFILFLMHIYLFSSNHLFLIKAVEYLSTSIWIIVILSLLLKNSHSKIHLASISILIQAIAPYLALIYLGKDNWERANG
ncbi:MAG: glycosyltransferase [Candidatus Rehaiarchaeum fermentans]|nr:glycosyltransferase [Candidatus Rehaiarchaeum fermentans]MCW1297419.1 glycosyltransferase [Candidatus Rehaiarchaeum fermentans]MCW1302476.1 glycosyltransferase [Candidatus Rehaiarchaeum fermentans]